MGNKETMKKFPETPTKSEKKEPLKNPYESAHFLSRLYLWWVLPFFWKGYKTSITAEDVYPCKEQDRSVKMMNKVDKHWQKEMQLSKEGKQPSLLRAVLKATCGPLVISTLLIIIKDCFFQVALPILIGQIVLNFSETDTDLKLYDSYYCAIGIALFVAGFSTTYHQWVYVSMNAGMKLRVALSSLMYKKCLKLSRAALGQTTTGQMVNLLSNDVQRFDHAYLFFPYLIAGPLHLLAVILVVVYLLSPYLLYGMLVFPFYAVLQFVMGSGFSHLRFKTSFLTDERIRLMNEIINGMRVIKMYSWEFAFAKLVNEARKREIAMIRFTAVLKALNISLFFVSSKLTLFISILAYVYLGGELNAYVVFTCMALFNSLRLSLTLFLPYGVAFTSEALISLKRIQSFLTLEEQDESKNPCASNERPDPENCEVSMQNFTGTWNKESETPSLQNISLSAKHGDLVIVIGAVGSGKTSLLMSLLGEMPASSGTIKMMGKASYASQDAWLMSGTVKENIIFDSEFDEEKYKKVIFAASLEKDLEQLPYGDKTLVGERGVSLSGGQKARVNLARALYYDADIFLLDDPLSAVDAAVSKHIFNKCIKGYLKKKITILCTHQIQFLKQATTIIILKEGKLFATGNYFQLASSGIDFGSLIQKSLDEDTQNQNTITEPSITSFNERESLTGSLKKTSFESITRGSFRQRSAESTRLPIHSETPSKEKLQVSDRLEAPKEELNTDRIPVSIYWKYIRTGGSIILLLAMTFFYLSSQILYNGIDYYLKIWTDLQLLCNDNSTRNSTEICTDSNQKSLFIYYYSGLTATLFVLSLLRNTAFFFVCLKASIRLHHNMFNCLIRTPIKFFDTNPSGIILNRCSRDIGLIDDNLPFAFSEFLEITLSILGVFVLLTVIRWYFLFPSILLVVMFYLWREVYFASGMNLKRIEGINKSPIFSHVAATMSGLATIRSFKAQPRFVEHFFKIQDIHTASYFLYISATECFGVILDLFCLMYIVLITVAMIATSGPLGGPAIGLAIAAAIGISAEFQWGARQSTEVEGQMTCVQRVLEYSNLDSEADLDSTPDKKPPPKWPDEGEIKYDNVSLYYSEDDPPVLKDLQFLIHPREKIGIVGRTGAGKSSMITSLFRMSEPSGKIVIDGVVINDIGLHDLRKKLSIIPQDPVLFTGTVRQNIDPFDEHDDKFLWSALEDVYLKEAVRDLPGGLDSKLCEGGSNFSIGQRQLICLARAILRRNKILILDEATANVDPETDSLIQKTIRDKFYDCTLITIAHRLHTIMDSDRIIVLDAGVIKEFDEPFQLLQNPKGNFYSMVQTTGPAMAKNLINIAKKTHLQKLDVLDYNPDKESMNILDSKIVFKEIPLKEIQENEQDVIKL